MYRDLLDQIVKYLHPKIETYLFTKFKYNTYSMYIIRTLNGRIELQQKIKTGYIGDYVIKWESDDLIIYYISGITEPLGLYISRKNGELILIKDILAIDNYNLKENILFEIANENEYANFPSKIDTIYKINNIDIQQINRGLEIFEKFCQNIMDIENYDEVKEIEPSTDEEKYISIFNQKMEKNEINILFMVRYNV